MLHQFEAVSNQGRSLTFLLFDTTSPFIVEDVDGLDPVKATISSSNYAGMDGAQFHGARREIRNIKLRLGLRTGMGTTLVKDLRKQLYGIFMPKSDVKLIFTMLFSNPVEIRGRVESFETVLFSKDPQVDINIMCFDPDFVDPSPIVVPWGSTNNDLQEIDYNYEGTTETGAIFRLKIDRSVNELKIGLRPANGEPSSLTFVNPLVNGDILEISTVPGDKYARLTRNGVTTSVLYGVSPDSDWVYFSPGVNYLQVYATGASFPYEFEYTTKYGGL